MGFHVEVDLSSGGSFRGYEAPVTDTPQLGTVLIIHEWFGLNAGMRLHADRFAADGFRALAVDLFGGKVAGDVASAQRLAAELKVEHANEVIAGAAKYMRSPPGASGKIGLAGFCLGGAVALAAANRLDDVGATVTFCGMPPDRHTDLSKIKSIVMGHYGMRDPVLPVAQPRALFEALTAGGKQALFHAYDAGHAFMRAGTQSYHAAVADLAWKRTLRLFHEVLG
jgi:carboxymethylenebutenolidase